MSETGRGRPLLIGRYGCLKGKLATLVECILTRNCKVETDRDEMTSISVVGCTFRQSGPTSFAMTIVAFTKA